MKALRGGKGKEINNSKQLFCPFCLPRGEQTEGTTRRFFFSSLDTKNE